MTRLKLAGFFLLVAYLATGLFIVKGNEKAAVRRFGQALAVQDGRLELRGSGLHYDLPWPFSQVDRINLSAVRNLTIGMSEPDELATSGFLLSAAPASASQFLTGDKNILNLQINVAYRVSERDCADFLYARASPQRHLRWCVESAAADLISRSGVDFVHPLGLGELRQQLTASVRQMAQSQRLGIEVDEVSINSVSPPVTVKSYFLDVADARNDKQQFINAANAYAVKRVAKAGAEAQKLQDEAGIYRDQTVEAARGRAKSFENLIAQFQEQERRGVHSYEVARRMALGRMYAETMSEILGKAAGKVLLDSGQEVDLTIFRNPKE